MEVPIPAEIITEILSHLGKNDLLKCRLVSHSWNGLSLKILRNSKYGHEHELTKDNIQKFIEFCDGRSGEWVLPLHLIKVCQNLQMPNCIQQLQTIFGEKCVGGLTLSPNSNSLLDSVKQLIPILTLLAPSLVYLDLSQFNGRYFREEAEMKVKEMLGKTQLNFPNLSRLISCPPPPTNWGKEKEENAILSFLISKSQNLKELEVFSPSDLLVIQKQISSFKKLKIVEPFVLKGLDIDNIFEPIRNGTVPVLRDLSVMYDIAYGPQVDHQTLYEFLSSFSTSLQSLTVVSRVAGQRISRILRNPLPNLSHLRLLRIQIPALPEGFAHNTARYGVDPEKLNLNSEAFPVLESMDIPTNIYFESENSKSENSKDDCILPLPTVKNLIVRVTECPFDPFGQSAKDYVDHLQKLFPNVTSLTLVNEIRGRHTHEEYLNQLLIGFIQSDGAPKIQELEIQNYEKNYMGHILNGLSPGLEPRVIIENMSLDAELLKTIRKAIQGFSGGSELSLKVDKQKENRDGLLSRVITCNAPIHLQMTGLEKIRMSFSKENRYDYGPGSGIYLQELESSWIETDLFLMSLPKYLPLLRQIDISQQLFGYDQVFCKQQIMAVQDKFPDLIINTTL